MYVMVPNSRSLELVRLHHHLTPKITCSFDHFRNHVSLEATLAQIFVFQALPDFRFLVDVILISNGE